jgi:cell division septal protein FtsQ
MTVTEKPTRADLIRKRRERRPRKSLSSSARRSQSARRSTLPPILVRGGMAASASQNNRNRKKFRRRYDIALNSQGAEMRLPSIPSITIGWRLMSGVLVIGLGYLIFTVWNSSMFKVSTINVVGLLRLTNQEINSVADVVGKSILLINPSIIEDQLQTAFPELANISVDVNFPNRITINVLERQPVLTWQEEGKSVWVDEDGVIFPVREKGDPGLTVIGTGLLSTSTNDPETSEEGEKLTPTLPDGLVSAILTISKEAPEGTPLMYDTQHGLGWQDPRGWVVYFGNGSEDMDMKLKVYTKIYRRLKKAGIRPGLISVENVHAPYYRLER